jgi:hypothetical protein
MAGRRGGYGYLIKPRLKEIEEWLADGVYEKDIITRLGTSRDTFYACKRDIPEFAEIFIRARNALITDLKKSLYQRAKGYEYEETKVVIDKDKDGNIKSQKIEKVKKHVSPDTGALIFSLTNLTQREEDKFYNRQDVQHSGDVDVNMVIGAVDEEE